MNAPLANHLFDFQILNCNTNEHLFFKTTFEQALEHLSDNTGLWEKKLKLYANSPLLTTTWFFTPPESSHSTYFCGIWPASCLLTSLFYELCLKIPSNQSLIQPSSFSTFSFLAASCKTPLTFCQVVICQPKADQLDLISKNLASFKNYAIQGLHLSHFYQASLSTTPLSASFKALQLQNQLHELLPHLPAKWSNLAASKLYRLLANSAQSFLQERSTRHIFKIACCMAQDQYYLLEQPTTISNTPPKRSCRVHYIKNFTQFQNRLIPIHGFIITLSFLDRDELLEERHLLAALREVGFKVTTALLYTSFKDPESHAYHFYCELAYASYPQLKPGYIPHLIDLLTMQLLERIERKFARVFLPRNEEESFKLAITLGQEVGIATDLPQVILNYEDQSDDKLFFRLIIAKPSSKDENIKTKLCQYQDKELMFSLERYRKMQDSALNKELAIIRVEATKTNFLRVDYSIDLQRARQKILKRLTKIMGPIRDYNGGLISKQQEALDQLLQWIELPHLRDQSMIEEMFYAIKPAVALSYVNVEILSRLFAQLLKTHKSINHHSEKLLIHQFEEEGRIYLTASCQSLLPFDQLQNYLQELNLALDSILWGVIHRSPCYLLACVIKNENQNLKKPLAKILKRLKN